MEKILKHQNAAYRWLSTYPKDYGEMMDFMAMARQELREAQKLLTAQIRDKSSEVKQDG